MAKKNFRKQRDYDGPGLTTYRVSDLLTNALAHIGNTYQDRPDLVIAAWPTVIGPKLATMTQVVSFCEGVLIVKVKNSTLHSLLSQHDKPRILKTLRQNFPRVDIKTIVFRIG